MNATEDEQDVQLQKVSVDLILDFDRSLTPFLRKQDGSGGTRLRSRVRVGETNRLVLTKQCYRTLTGLHNTVILQLLEPFQELPQLLDPYLAKFIPILSEAYLEHLRLRRGRRGRAMAMRDYLLMPLPAAVCRLIYTFCKIRGENVILRFLNVETKYLELVLSAIQDAERYPALPQDDQGDQGGQNNQQDIRLQLDDTAKNVTGLVPWTWEERYVSLLWLSQLFLAPFDLSTISSVDMEDLEIPNIDGLKWPSNLPGLVFRVVPLAIKYLSSAGKERNGAKELLVRVAMRKDMQELGMLKALVQWALFALRPKRDARVDPPYHYIGVLSFLAGVLRSSIDTSDMDAYLEPIFYAVQAITPDSDDDVYKVISSSGLARKTNIKVIRSIAALVLRHPQDDRGTAIIEDTISYLLESVADNDTPVRLAASKALSIIALKLDPEMASEVIVAVLDSLNKNVLSKPNPIDSSAPPTRDISNVDPLEWHGLMLTLSHLLYRRSPPAENLADIVSALLTGLAFERRGMGGGSVGTNVRDASCFGIWAMARRYTTAELLAVEAPTLTPWFHDMSSSESQHTGGSSNRPRSILQVLATQLVVTASLDSAGNIRRGASAALQELIGRHPDTVIQGIDVVQAVDYHAVALRSRAIKEVALRAAELDSLYGEALIDGLLGWRGIGDMDAASRRVAGETFGMLILKLVRIAPESKAPSHVAKSVQLIITRLKGLQQRQVEERHGLLICLASVIDNLIPDLWQRKGCARNPAFGQLVQRLISEIAVIVENSRSSQFRRPELAVEAASRLIVSSLPVLQAALMISPGQKNTDTTTNATSRNVTKSADDNPIIFTHELLAGGTQLSPTYADEFAKTSKSTDAILRVDEHRQMFDPAIGAFKQAVSEWLFRSEPEVVEQTSQAALSVLAFSSPEDKVSIIQSWAEAIKYRPTSARTASGAGYFHALAATRRVFVSADTMPRGSKISDAILTRWQEDKDIDTRVSILKSLALSGVLAKEPLKFVDLLTQGLDNYTTTARGDIGSLVRLESLRATGTIWRDIGRASNGEEVGGKLESLCMVVNRLYLPVLRLSAEKLDRVRVEAQRVLALSLKDESREHFTRLTFSSQPYFQFLLELRWKEWLHPTIAEAAITSLSSSEITTTPSGRPSDASYRAAAEDAWMAHLLSGFVTSADTGNEELVMCARSALVGFCDESIENLKRVATALVGNLRAHTTTVATTTAAAVVVLTSPKSTVGSINDRMLVPTLEIISFLLRTGVLTPPPPAAYIDTIIDLRSLCLLVQKAAYKSGNVRKIEACVRVYGSVATTLLPPLLPHDGGGGGGSSRDEKGVMAAREARKRLGALLFHPWPRVRSLVVDELWGVLGGGDGNYGDGDGHGGGGGGKGGRQLLLGIDWGRAGKEDVRKIISELGLV